VATNLALDDELIRTAQELGCHKTKKAAVTAALEDYIRRKRLDLLFALADEGVEYDADYDIVEERRKWAERLEQQQEQWDQ
jgi:Arc/MetJ family transcription regulator